MTEVIALIGDSNVNRHLDSAKAANPSDRSIRQSHLIVAFNAVQLQSALVSQNEHRKVVVLAALTKTSLSLTFDSSFSKCAPGFSREEMLTMVQTNTS